VRGRAAALRDHEYLVDSVIHIDERPTEPGHPTGNGLGVLTIELSNVGCIGLRQASGHSC
jgi:hypothetical protein